MCRKPGLLVWGEPGTPSEEAPPKSSAQRIGEAKLRSGTPVSDLAEMAMNGPSPRGIDPEELPDQSDPNVQAAQQQAALELKRMIGWGNA